MSLKYLRKKKGGISSLVIPLELMKRFWEVIEISNVPWNIVDDIVISNANVLRPIKGVCFETLFCSTIRKYVPDVKILPGKGDEDTDVYLNGIRLQLKTVAKGSTNEDVNIGVSLHKTHGRERRPDNLYPTDNPTFDYLVLLHPDDGILIIPFDEIPENKNWPGYLSDPAIFDWNSEWKNRWDLLGFTKYQGMTLENRETPQNSVLPQLSKITYLEDYEIIETLCRPENFRAAVMGLKGNIKEFWIIELLKIRGYKIDEPKESYPKYDFKITNSQGRIFRVQVKGTSKNMCNLHRNIIGVEIMGTHGRFPERGYHKCDFDYIAIIISPHQLNPQYNLTDELHFIFIPVSDLPQHYLIGKGDENTERGWRNKRWNLVINNDVIYPNIKLNTKFDNDLNRVVLIPCILCYKRYKGYQIIPYDSPFKGVGPYILDEIPADFDQLD